MIRCGGTDESFAVISPASASESADGEGAQPPRIRRPRRYREYQAGPGDSDPGCARYCADASHSAPRAPGSALGGFRDKCLQPFACRRWSPDRRPPTQAWIVGLPGSGTVGRSPAYRLNTTADASAITTLRGEGPSPDLLSRFVPWSYRLAQGLPVQPALARPVNLNALGLQRSPRRSHCLSAGLSPGGLGVYQIPGRQDDIDRRRENRGLQLRGEGDRDVWHRDAPDRRIQGIPGVLEDLHPDLGAHTTGEVPSSASTTRPVLMTDLTTVMMSSGTSVRRSITSAEILLGQCDRRFPPRAPCASKQRWSRHFPRGRTVLSLTG